MPYTAQSLRRMQASVSMGTKFDEQCIKVESKMNNNTNCEPPTEVGQKFIMEIIIF